MKTNEKYKITGMSCAACQARVEKAVSSLDGVKNCSVSLLTNSMVIDRDEKLSPKDIEKAVKASGYGASLLKEKETTLLSKDNEVGKLLFILIFSIIFLIPLFYLSMGYMNGWYIFNLEKYPIDLASIELVLASVIVGINNRFFRNGFKAIFHGGPNMDTLVALGSGIAYIYSLIIYILMIVNYNNSSEVMRLSMNITFETAGMVVTLITIGKLLEAYSKGKTTNAIKKLLELRPNIAHKYVHGTTIDVDSNELLINDLYLVKPGELFPADGIIVKGFTSIDESSLTGESIPVDKHEGDLTRTGTINLNGSIVCKATAIGKDTTIAKIAEMVEIASSTKTKIARLADKISLFFVPSVIGIALLTFGLWMLLGGNFVATHDLNVSLLSYSISRGISVLVISCPCALGLATPVAIMVGNGKGARNGILFKSAHILEETGKVDIVVFDKTGTLTIGRPTVREIFFDKITKEEFLNYVYSLEANSNHPYGKAIVEYAKEKNSSLLEVKNFEDIPGIGVKGLINDEEMMIVKEDYLLTNGIKNPFIKESDSLKKNGTTQVYLLINDQVKGMISLSDEIRKDADKTVKLLKDIGITPIMLTGDNELSARSIASQAGINDVISNVLPEQKYEVVKKLQEQGKVMMIGDGINDSIALSQADIGVAISKGSDIAIESADIVLTKDSLVDIYASIILSRKTLLNIKENLFWAFLYNIIMIPIAAGAFSGVGLYKLAPWMGSAAMSLSSVTVVLNALRINLYNIYKERKHSQKRRIEYKPIELEKERSVMKIKVEGMMCMHCVAHVKSALEKLDGVTNVNVTLETGLAEITTSKEISDEQIKTAIEDSGYKVVNIER